MKKSAEIKFMKQKKIVKNVQNMQCLSNTGNE